MPDMGPAVDDLLDDVFNVAATSQSTESVSVPPDIGQDPPLIPDRVLVFTSKSLLSVLTVAKRGHVDGTFKCMCKQWKVGPYYQLLALTLNSFFCSKCLF